MTYLEGVLELMSPSRDHAGIKTYFARLLEIYALERGLPLNGYGSTTFRKRAKERGLDVPEVWFWEDGRLAIWQLGTDGYRAAGRSRFLPDLVQLLGFLRPHDQTEAVRAYRDALRA